jgi:hypothetical protein
MKTVRLIGSFTPFIHRPRRKSQLEREITVPTQSEVPDVDGKTYNHLYYKIEEGAMRKLLALPKLLAVFTVAAATLLLVGAASAGLSYLHHCEYRNNGAALWCMGQEVLDGRWVWVGVMTYRTGYIPGSYGVEPLAQYLEQVYVWNGSSWGSPVLSRPYSLIGGSSQTTLTSSQAWVSCLQTNQGRPWWEQPGIIINNTCGLPPT